MSSIAGQRATFASAITNGAFQCRTYVSDIPIRKYEVRPLEDARQSAMFMNASKRANFLRHPIRKRDTARNALRLAEARLRHSKMTSAPETNSSEEIPGIAVGTTFTAPRVGEEEETVPNIKARPPLEWERQRMIAAARQRENTGFIRALQDPNRRPALHSKTIRKHRIYINSIYQALCDGTKRAPALPVLAMDLAQWQITAEDHRSRGKPLFAKAQENALLELDTLEDDLLRVSQGVLQALEQVRSFKVFVGSLECAPQRERSRRALSKTAGDEAEPPTYLVQKSEHLPESAGEFANYAEQKEEVESDSKSHYTNVVTKAEEEAVEANFADHESDSPSNVASKAEAEVIWKANFADSHTPEAELERAKWELEYIKNITNGSGIEP